MKTRNYIALVLAGVTILVSGGSIVEPSATRAPSQNSAVEGPGSGNGGKGVMINGKPYLLDLVEGGVEQNPFFAGKPAPNADLLRRVEKIFGSDPNFPRTLIAAKLAEIQAQSYAAAQIILEAMDLYQWRLVNLAPGMVNDQREGVQVNPNDYRQIGKRLSRAIIIDRASWNLMDEGNRTALIFHEAIYAFAKPFKGTDGYMHQDVGAVQEATAFLFSPEMQSTSEMLSFLSPLFPDNYYFGGEQLVNDNVSQMISLDPSIVFVLGRTQVDYKNGEYLFELSGRYLEALRGTAEDSTTKQICSKIPNGTSYLRFRLKNQYKFLYPDQYEGPGNARYSYVALKQFPHIREAGGLPVPVTRKTCVSIFHSVYESAVKEMMDGFKIIQR